MTEISEKLFLLKDEKYKAFNDKFNYLDDGKAAQRVTEAIIEE